MNVQGNFTNNSLNGTTSANTIADGEREKNNEQKKTEKIAHETFAYIEATPTLDSVELINGEIISNNNPSFGNKNVEEVRKILEEVDNSQPLNSERRTILYQKICNFFPFPTMPPFEALLKSCKEKASLFWGASFLNLCFDRKLPKEFFDCYLYLHDKYMLDSHHFSLLKNTFDHPDFYTHELFFKNENKELISRKISFTLLNFFPGFIKKINEKGKIYDDERKIYIPSNPYNEQILLCCYSFFNEIPEIEKFIENISKYSPDEKILNNLFFMNLPKTKFGEALIEEKKAVIQQFLLRIETCLKNNYDKALQILINFYYSYFKKHYSIEDNEGIIPYILSNIQIKYYKDFIQKIHNNHFFKTHDIIYTDFDGTEKMIQVNKYILAKNFPIFEKLPLDTQTVDYRNYHPSIIDIINSCYFRGPRPKFFESFIENALHLRNIPKPTCNLNLEVDKLDPDQDFFQIIFRETLSEELDEKNFLGNFLRRMRFCRENKYTKAEEFLAEAYLLYAHADDDIKSELFSEIFSYIYLNNLLSLRCELIINNTLNNTFHKTHLIKFDKKEMGVNLYFLAKVSTFFQQKLIDFSGKNKKKINFSIYDGTIMENVIDYCYFCEKEKFQSKITKENHGKYLDYANLIGSTHVISAILEKICLLYDQEEVNDCFLLKCMIISLEILSTSNINTKNINTKFIRLLVKTSLAYLIEPQRFSDPSFIFSQNLYLKDLEQSIRKFGREIDSFSTKNCKRKLIDNGFLPFLFKTCPNIEKLELPNCKKITIKSLESIVNLSKLTYLDMHNCPKINSEILNSLLQLKELEEIILTNTNWISLKVFNEFAKNLPKLKKIDFSMTYFPEGERNKNKNIEISIMTTDSLENLAYVDFPNAIIFNAYGNLDKRARDRLSELYLKNGKKINFPDYQNENSME